MRVGIFNYLATLSSLRKYSLSRLFPLKGSNYIDTEASDERIAQYDIDATTIIIKYSTAPHPASPTL